MPRWLFCVVTGAATWVLGCGGGGSSPGGNTTTAGPANNVAPIVAGGSAQNPAGIVNGAFTSVTICPPGSSNCATIGGMLVDTGSTGVRVLASVLPGGFSLPKQTDVGGNPIVECFQFSDSFTWGPVETADIKIAGEQAGSVPIQIIADPAFSTVPTSCTNKALGPNENTVQTLGANGILGVGNFLQDCGPACTTSGASNPDFYFSCPTASTCTITTESLAQQVAHPVAGFASDNNGVLVELPAVTAGGAVSENGSLVFGIGTQSNNALGSVTVLTLNPNGDFTTMFNGKSFSGFVDSGSNGIFFLDSATTGLPMCPVNKSFYCPASVENFSATNGGSNGRSTAINFFVANADGLFAPSPPNFLLPGLSAPNPNSFDWGLPFFYGRNVFVAIEGRSTPGGTGPYTAY